jgi:hypothetical protein
MADQENIDTVFIALPKRPCALNRRSPCVTFTTIYGGSIDGASCLVRWKAFKIREFNHGKRNISKMASRPRMSFRPRP